MLLINSLQSLSQKREREISPHLFTNQSMIVPVGVPKKGSQFRCAVKSSLIPPKLSALVLPIFWIQYFVDSKSTRPRALPWSRVQRASDGLLGAICSKQSIQSATGDGLVIQWQFVLIFETCSPLPVNIDAFCQIMNCFWKIHLYGFSYTQVLADSALLSSWSSFVQNLKSLFWYSSDFSIWRRAKYVHPMLQQDTPSLFASGFTCSQIFLKVCNRLFIMSMRIINKHQPCCLKTHLVQLSRSTCSCIDFETLLYLFHRYFILAIRW